MGYCGNMCRPFAIGKIPDDARKLAEAALEAMEYALKAIRPGRRASEVFEGYHDILAKYGYENFTLYGPAHSTGHSEVEGMWLAQNAAFTIEPNMSGIGGMPYMGTAIPNPIAGAAMAVRFFSEWQGEWRRLTATPFLKGPGRSSTSSSGASTRKKRGSSPRWGYPS
jgi:hypothetical protein